jgi:hypothetical protein
VRIQQRMEDLTVPCPTCEVPEGEFCVNRATGEVSHIPCVARLRKDAS